MIGDGGVHWLSKWVVETVLCVGWQKQVHRAEHTQEPGMHTVMLACMAVLLLTTLLHLPLLLPAPHSFLSAMWQVLVTPHSAFLTHEALANIAGTTVQNVTDFLDGKPLTNELKTKPAKKR